MSFFRGDSGSSRERTQAVKEDTTRYSNGLKDRGVLSEAGKTLDGYLYHKVIEKCEYMGIKFKKGDYISLDTRHWKWEWFGKNKQHKGAIDPIKGELYKKPDPTKTIKVP